MEKILVNGFDVRTMCRLCLARDVAELNIFSFSIKLMDQVADVIMKCAPVQITRCEEMPNFICQSCYTQLEKSYQFQKKIILSDQTLRRYLQQLPSSNKQIKVECSIEEPSEDHSIQNTDTDITMECVTSEFQDVSDNHVNLKDVSTNYTSAYKFHEKIFLKSEIEEEPHQLRTSNIQIKTECSIQGSSKHSLIHNTNTDIARKCKSSEIQDVGNVNLEVPSNYTSTCNEDVSLKFKIKEEPIDDKSLISTGFKEEPMDNNSSIPTDTDNLIDTLYGDDESIEIKLKNSEIEEQSESITCVPLVDSIGYFDNREDENESTSERHKKHKKSNNTKYKCDFCNKQFIFLSRYNTHKRTHTGEKPYRCDVCNKCFGESGVLIKHQRVHTGEKPYQCDVCNQRFSFSHVLVRHKRVHTGEKPYKCEFCNKKFTQSGSLRNHERKHSRQLNFMFDREKQD